VKQHTIDSFGWRALGRPMAPLLDDAADALERQVFFERLSGPDTLFEISQVLRYLLDLSRAGSSAAPTASLQSSLHAAAGPVRAPPIPR
jgi:hypothetical protein